MDQMHMQLCGLVADFTLGFAPRAQTSGSKTLVSMLLRVLITISLYDISANVHDSSRQNLLFCFVVLPDHCPCTTAVAAKVQARSAHLEVSAPLQHGLEQNPPF